MVVKIRFVKTQRSHVSTFKRFTGVAAVPNCQKCSSLIGIGVLGVATRNRIGYVRRSVGVSPSGKAPVFGIGIPRFESWHPSHLTFIFLGNTRVGREKRVRLANRMHLI